MTIKDEDPTNLKQQRATYAIFLIAGLAMSAWAPLIPHIQSRLGVNDARLGMLLFCIAAGSMSIMPFTGKLIIRFGYRSVILCCCIGFSINIPLLLLTNNLILIVFALWLFGALNGLIDVTMNAHAVAVERSCSKAIMSGFHGFYSIGAIAGAGIVSVFLMLAFSPLHSAIPVVLIIIFLTLFFVEGIMSRCNEIDKSEGSFVILKYPIVISISLICFILFLCEGAMLDWSAVLMHSVHGAALSHAGISFTCYSIAVAVSRLLGSRLIYFLGKKFLLIFGSLLALTGLLLAVWANIFLINLLGFILTGLGIANLVPMLFSAAGNIPGVAVEHALPMVTLIGYTGLLVGPALIGLGAEIYGLTSIFTVLAIVLLLTGLATNLIIQQLQSKPNS